MNHVSLGRLMATWTVLLAGLWNAAGGTNLYTFAGPTEIQDTFLPAQLRSQPSPESACTLPVKRWSAKVTVDWTANLARTDTYLFDGESVTTTLKVRHSPVANWEFGFDLPYTERIDGALDGFIEQVETTLNQRVAARYNLPRDTYQAFVGTTRPELILKKEGGFQDLNLRAKFQFLHAEQHGLDAAAAATFSLPTGNDTFGGDGVSPGLGLHLQRPLPMDHTLCRGINLFLGGVGNYYSNPREQDFLMNDLRGMGYGGFEWKVFRPVALVALYQVYTPLVPDHPPLNQPAHYWSLTGRLWLGPHTTLEAGFGENSFFGLIENRNSYDVTFRFALTHRF